MGQRGTEKVHCTVEITSICDDSGDKRDVRNACDTRARDSFEHSDICILGSQLFRHF